MNNKLPPSRTADQYVLRFPCGMRQEIKLMAEKNDRSMNNELIQLIKKGMGLSNDKQS